MSPGDCDCDCLPFVLLTRVDADDKTLTLVRAVASGPMRRVVLPRGDDSALLSLPSRLRIVLLGPSTLLLKDSIPPTLPPS